jgi:hypothetical protein
MPLASQIAGSRALIRPASTGARRRDAAPPPRSHSARCERTTPGPRRACCGPDQASGDARSAPGSLLRRSGRREPSRRPCSRLWGRCRRAPASWQSESSAKLATRPAPARASESERARSRMADPGSVADGLARAGCGSGQAWLRLPLGARGPGTGPIVTSLARSASRHLSPIVMSGSGRLRGFCDSETRITRGTRHLRRCSDRATTSSMGCSAALLRAGGQLGLRLGRCAFRGA